MGNDSHDECCPKIANLWSVEIHNTIRVFQILALSYLQCIKCYKCSLGVLFLNVFINHFYCSHRKYIFSNENEKISLHTFERNFSPVKQTTLKWKTSFEVQEKNFSPVQHSTAKWNTSLEIQEKNCMSVYKLEGKSLIQILFNLDMLEIAKDAIKYGMKL